MNKTHIFIVNSFAGSQYFADNLRQTLEKIEGLHYFVFSTRYKGDETELVRKVLHFFNNKNLRFYCCGGSGTLRNMLNGFDDLSKAEVAFIPFGLTNDFLKVFRKDAALFKDINNLIQGQVVKVDYIRTNHGIALNECSAGMTVGILRKTDKNRELAIFGNRIPYLVSILMEGILPKKVVYEMTTVDGIEGSRKRDEVLVQLFFGNGSTAGGNIQYAPWAKITDGLSDYALVKRAGFFDLLGMLPKLYTDNADRINRRMVEFGNCEKMILQRKDGKPFYMDMDGELPCMDTKWEMEIVHQGLNFVVPKGVRVR